MLTVRTKDRNDHEPTSPRGIIPSFERKNYQACIINDLAFEETGSQNADVQAKTAQETRERQQTKGVCILDRNINYLCHYL